MDSERYNVSISIKTIVVSCLLYHMSHVLGDLLFLDFRVRIKIRVRVRVKFKIQNYKSKNSNSP